MDSRSSVSSTIYHPSDVEAEVRVGPNSEKKNEPIIISDGDPFLVTLQEREHPQHISLGRRWLAILIISTASLCVASTSSIASFTEDGVAKEFHVSHEVTILSISLFVLGLAMGPLLVGPLSEVYGRNLVYRISYGLFFALSWPVSFAPNITVYLVFRFITGFCGAAFVSVSGSSASDMFDDKHVANPMAVVTVCPFIGPALGPLISGFINQNLDWRWTYHITIIWAFAELIALFLCVPETYVPVLTVWKAKSHRKDSGDARYWAPLEREAKTRSISKLILVSCYKPFQLILLERMAFLLDLWTSLILGILYLAFQAFPIIFKDIHEFNVQSTGMAFLGIGVGMIIAISTQPFWNRLYRSQAERHNGTVPPEARLYMGEVGGVLVPVGLFWLAFTTYRGVPWIVPIVASIPFGSGIYFVFTSTFTYLVTAYRPIAASAMAANAAMRCSFAAAFPLFAGPMYNRLGTVGATALLAGLTALMAPLPFVFRRIGPRLRKNSKFAV